MECIDNLVDWLLDVFEIPYSVEMLVECIIRPFVYAQCIISRSFRQLTERFIIDDPIVPVGVFTFVHADKGKTIP